MLMNKIVIPVLLLLLTTALYLVSCDKANDSVAANSFENLSERSGPEQRTMVVVSDLQIGNDCSDCSIGRNPFDGMLTLEVWDACQQTNTVTVMSNIDIPIGESLKRSFFDELAEARSYGLPGEGSDLWTSVIPTTR